MLRAGTEKYLRDRMSDHDDLQQLLENSTYEHIRAAGRVMVNSDGSAYCTTGRRLDAHMFNRLITSGRLIPMGDSMFDTISQTYVVA